MNRKTQYVGKLLSACWNIDKLRGRTLLSSLVHTLIRNDRPEEDIFGDALPVMQKLGNIAVIPLIGVISIDVPDWIKEYGICLTDANDIEKELADALRDANIDMIVFDVSSPGGLSIAGDKLFDVVEAAGRKKPVFAYCADGRDMASSAYEAVASARALACGYYAEGVGCVGTYLAYLDDTEFWTQLGIKWELFKSGDIKGIGESVPLTDVQRVFLQEQVDLFGGNFRRNVKKYRTGIADDDLQGQYYDGKTAAKRGFVGFNADDLQTAIAKFKKLI